MFTPHPLSQLGKDSDWALQMEQKCLSCESCVLKWIKIETLSLCWDCHEMEKHFWKPFSCQFFRSSVLSEILPLYYRVVQPHYQRSNSSSANIQILSKVIISWMRCIRLVWKRSVGQERCSQGFVQHNPEEIESSEILQIRVLVIVFPPFSLKR